MKTKLLPSKLSLTTLLVAVITLCALPRHLMATTVRTNWAAAGTYTWTCPTGVSSVQVECWGGGGQGGNVHVARTSGSYTASAGGGGGGAYAKKTSMPVTAGSSYTITIPAATYNTSDIANGAHHDGVGVGFTNLVTDVGGQTYVFAGGGTGGTNYNGNVGGSTTGGGAGSSTTSGADASQNGGGGATAVSSGGGGGGGAGDNGAGVTATTGTGAAGGSGTIQSGGGGGTGAATSANGGAAQTGPGGGGGGSRTTASSGNQNPTVYGGAGGLGMVVLTYNDPGLSLSTNAFLTSLVLTPAGTLSPAFATNTYSYNASEAFGATPTVTVTNADLTATNTLSLNGGTPVGLVSGVASSPLTLTVGITNTITVQVKAQDNLTVKTYSVTIAMPSASPYYWDGNDSTAGFGTAGGTWGSPTAGTTTSGWSTNVNGTATVNGNSITTGTNDTLNFGSIVGSTTNGLVGGTITVSGTVNAGNLVFSPGSTAIAFSGGTAINLANTATITLSGGHTENFITPLSGAGTSLLITGDGTAKFSGGNAGFGAGGMATIAGSATLNPYTGGANGLGGATGFTINLGDATTGGSIYIGNSVGLANSTVVTAGSGFRSISLYNNNTTPSFSGNITAHTNLYIIYGGYNSGKAATVSGTNNTIDSGATVTMCMISATGSSLNDNAIWTGSGAVEYTSAALTNVSSSFTNVSASSSATFNIQNWQSTYAGGAYIHDFTNGSYCVVYPGNISSDPTNGAFGVGTLTLGNGAALRAFNWQDPTAVKNPVVISGDVTFPTWASEVNFVFTNTVNLGSATRTLTCNVGASVAGKMVDFQGVVSGTGGINMAGTGWLRLSGANTYTGNTTISAGTLDIAQPYLAAGSIVAISNGAVLNLEFATTNVVAGFITNGVSLAPGVYGSAEVSPFITGSGYLQVGSAGPSGPATLTNSFSGGTLSLSWPAGQGWRLQEQTNSLSVGLSTNWNYITDASVSSTNIMVEATKPTVFYRLRHP